MDKVTHLDSFDTEIQPVLVMLGIPSEGEFEAESASLRVASSDGTSSETSDFYGLALLQHIATELSNSTLSKLVVPVSVFHKSESETLTSHPSTNNRLSRPSSGGFPTFGLKSSSPRRAPGKNAAVDPRRALRCVDNGAIDVLTSPLQEDRLRGLTVHGYRAHKEMLKDRAKFMAQKKARKQSWLGSTDDKKYGYLREAMVSTLMKGICNPDEAMQIIDLTKLPNPEPKRHAGLAKAVGTWGFSGHDYSEDELIHAAFLMLQHVVSIPELQKWRLSTVELKTFLMASRAAYNGFVNYHNFRHVVDVMQAVFYFLVEIGTLPPYPASIESSCEAKVVSPIAALLKPFDALTLLITAIGHDVGHPGVNNAFLVALNAPLAQLYNDKSVLEAFHCAAYSQILRRHWKAAFEDIPMRALMINSILATDMGMHFYYMEKLGQLQAKVHHNRGIDGWNPQTLDEYRVLACALLVKCADISNVVSLFAEKCIRCLTKDQQARPFDVAAKWAGILQLEFSNQGLMEKDVGIPTTLFGGPPELGNIIKLGNSQNSFMNIFARPLFEAVTDILPTMVFAVDEMKANQKIWTNKIQSESAKLQISGMKRPSEGLLSPKSGSPDRSLSQPELSHPEGLPASQSMESSPLAQLARASEDAQAAEQSRRASASSIQAHLIPLDGSAQSVDNSRRSSLAHPFSNIGSNSDSTSYSRRSSGASPAASTSHATVAARRMSNSFPSQLQLGPNPDSRSQTRSSGTTTSENKQPNGRISEDTLSQTPVFGPAMSSNSSRCNSRGSGGAGDVRRGSNGNDGDEFRSKRFVANGPSGRPYTHMVHHRSSSGAHTNNTIASQTTPYSPTGTQATSVLTVDSDGKRSNERFDSWTSPDRNGMPAIVNIDRPGSGHRSKNMNGYDVARDVNVKTSVMNHNNFRENGHHRVVGRKSSRFNFNFWKKRKSTEASP